MKISDPRVRRIIELLAADWCCAEPTLEWAARGRVLSPDPTVYFLVSSDQTIEYIGQTKNLRQRMSQHESNPRMAKVDWARVYYFAPQIESLDTRLVTEAILVLLTRPKRNQALMLRKTRWATWVEMKFSSWGKKKPKKKVATGIKSEAQ